MRRSFLRHRRPRQALLYVVVVALVTLVMALTSSRAARAADTNAASPRAASHAGRLEGDHVLWEVTFVMNESDSSSRVELIELARPVVADLDTAHSPGVTAVRDAAGAIVAFAVDTHRLYDWRERVRVLVRAPLTREGNDVILLPPLARGDAVQRIDVAGPGELRLEPDPALGLVHHVGSWTTPEVSDSARDASDALLERRSTPLDEALIYVVAGSPALDRGLRGRTLTQEERARPGKLLAIGVFVLLAAGCAGAYRWLAGDARLEEAEAALEEEYARDAGRGG